MIPERRFRRIIDEGLCIGCGLCRGIAGPDRLRMTVDANGELRPAVIGRLDDEIVDRIYATCPGTRVEGPDEATEPRTDLVWGEYRRIVRGWAADPAVRHEGSTAGVLTALARHLLRSGEVAFILHARASSTRPAFGEAAFSFTEEEVQAGAGSRYGPAAVLEAMDEALSREEPFALVAKPCDLSAVRNLADVDDRVGRFLRYRLAMVCGAFLPGAEFDRFLRESGVPPGEVRRVRYRGRGCPGPTTVELADGSVRYFHYLDLWEDESALSSPFRCKICPDAIGETADVVAADTWPGGSPDRKISETDPGENTLIVRTRAGASLLDAAVEAGALILGDDAEPELLYDTQPHQVRKKFAVGARLEALKAAGRMAPATMRLRLDELSARNGEVANRVEADGISRRIKAAPSGTRT